MSIALPLRGIMQSTQQTDSDAPTLASVTRMIDMRIPLVWLMTGAFTVAGILAGMYYTLQQVQHDMQEMKVLLKSNDGAAQELKQEMAVQKFRLTSMENELAALKGAARATPVLPR